MMNALEDKARKRGYRALVLETGRQLSGALRLYDKLGYRTIENYGQYAGLPDSVCMCKRL